ncbi:MAG: Mur ligase family protein, partial [Candidatus Neomarinimicrobiota bacterium]|nr:Mur ligase family protein [Candidatus Neomarinimicrobiota bacterium]
MLNISNKNLLNKKITIIGLKKSGYAATILGHELGANIFVSEIDNDLEIITNKNKLIKKGVDVETGNHSKLVYDADFWVVSPGVPNDIEIIKQAKTLNIPIIGEIEFASRFTSTPIIAVTGSNGKSTTVNILYSMLKTDKLQPILAGNIGIPFSEKVFEELKNPDLGNIYILEISSFQLEFIEQFRAMICVYLNISPDHLDRHENMDKYLKIKLNMIKNHKKDDTVVYNNDDPILDVAFNDYLLEK